MKYMIAEDAWTHRLAACVPDGDYAALHRQLAEYCSGSSRDDHEESIFLVRGVTLTNTRPDSDRHIVWHSLGELTQLTDEHGNRYEYAVKQEYRYGESEPTGFDYVCFYCAEARKGRGPFSYFSSTTLDKIEQECARKT